MGEMAVERHTGDGCAADGQAGAPSTSDLTFLHESCAIYLRVPIIPRFEARLRRCVSGLCDSGLLQPGSSLDPSATGDHTGKPGLQLVVDSIVSPASSKDVSGGPAGSEFGSSGKGLGAFRVADRVRACFRETLMAAAEGHLDCGCALDVRRRVLAGMQAALLLMSGDSWSEERQFFFVEALASVPQRPSCLVVREEEFEEVQDEDDDDSFPELRSTSAVVLEDVTLDLWADLQDGEVFSRIVCRDRCGLCCTT